MAALSYFKQTFPVIPRSMYADEINACLKSSALWRTVKNNEQLKVNMRVQTLPDPLVDTLYKKLLYVGFQKVAVHGCIKLSAVFYTIIK